jgi:threonyl-tRNA synthetase
MKVPYLAVIGKREAESDMVAVNVRGAGKEQKPAPVAVGEFVDRVLAEVKSRSLTLESGIGNRESGIGNQ